MSLIHTGRVVCVKNDEFPVSLTLDKVYEVIHDEGGAKHGLVRVVDDSGEDYLYPESFFVASSPELGAEKQSKRNA